MKIETTEFGYQESYYTSCNGKESRDMIKVEIDKNINAALLEKSDMSSVEHGMPFGKPVSCKDHDTDQKDCGHPGGQLCQHRFLLLW